MRGHVSPRREAERERNAQDRAAHDFGEADVPFRQAVMQKMRGLDDEKRDVRRLRREAHAPLYRSGPGPVNSRYHSGQLETAEDFEYAAVAEGLQSLADDLSAVIEQKRARLEEQALEVYYTAEELARDPEHADLIPLVERMRQAYQNDYGRPIPPRKKA